MVDNKSDYRISVTKIIDKNLMYLSENEQFFPKERPEREARELHFLRIDEICFEDKAPRKEALENALSAICIEGINFIFLIKGDSSGVHFYYGITKDDTSTPAPLSPADISEQILKPSIQGNFRGSKVVPVNPDDKSKLIRDIKNMKYSGILEGVPGENEDEEQFQGVDRLVDVMQGDEFAFMVIAKPLSKQAVTEIQNNIYDLYSKLIPLSKQNIQATTNDSHSTNTATTVGTSSSTADGTSFNTSEGTSHQDGTNTGTSYSRSGSSNNNRSYNSGRRSEGSSTSTTAGESSGKSHSDSKTHNETVGTTHQYTHGDSHSVSESITEGTTTGASASFENTNKGIQDWIQYFDEVFLKRLDYGRGKGIFAVTIATLANNRADLFKLQNTVSSLYSGKTGNRVPLKAVTLDSISDNAIRNFRIPYGKIKNTSIAEVRALHSAMSHVIEPSGYGYIGNWITTNEMSIVTGLPQKEVVGLKLKEEVEFGLNPPNEMINDDNKIELGRLVQSGNIIDKRKVYIDRAALDQHIFIAGVTGSGKTTTCQKLISAADSPFLVIEPAKTEYRIMLDKYPDMLVFTLGNSKAAPLMLNPFVFYKHESISGHVDMIKACIESAFDMEAAIPQIIETAIYKSYEAHGWDINTNENYKYNDTEDAFKENSGAFPTLSEMIEQCKEVVKQQGFDERLHDEYIGSINARLQGLCVGAKGMMLDTANSVDFTDLLDKHVVIELENIKSANEKALIMGFILIKLNEAIKAKYLQQGKIKHLTLVEEAHRLLSKYQPGDAPNKKHGVEMFSDMLAEIRKYGESLIIVDQIPNKLTPEVLKNTNTKIIHRLFAADDKEAVGNTIMLTDEQKSFLSNLTQGRVVFFSNNMDKAVQLQIDKESDTSAMTPTDDAIMGNVMEYYRRHYKVGYINGSELFEQEPTVEQFNCMREVSSSNVIRRFLGYCKDRSYSSDKEFFRKSIQRFEDQLGQGILAQYIVKYMLKEELTFEKAVAFQNWIKTFLDRGYTNQDHEELQIIIR